MQILWPKKMSKGLPFRHKLVIVNSLTKAVIEVGPIVVVRLLLKQLN
jgi:hypothetical protein